MCARPWPAQIRRLAPALPSTMTQGFSRQRGHALIWSAIQSKCRSRMAAVWASKHASKPVGVKSQTIGSDTKLTTSYWWYGAAEFCLGPEANPVAKVLRDVKPIPKPQPWWSRRWNASCQSGVGEVLFQLRRSCDSEVWWKTHLHPTHDTASLRYGQTQIGAVGKTNCQGSTSDKPGTAVLQNLPTTGLHSRNKPCSDFAPQEMQPCCWLWWLQRLGLYPEDPGHKDIGTWHSTRALQVVLGNPAATLSGTMLLAPLYEVHVWELASSEPLSKPHSGRCSHLGLVGAGPTPKSAAQALLRGWARAEGPTLPLLRRWLAEVAAKLSMKCLPWDDNE